MATKRRHYIKDPGIALRLLKMAAPSAPNIHDTWHLKTRSAYERMRDGGADTDDFDLLAQQLNCAAVRAETIDPALVELIGRAQMALVRAKERYLKGLTLGFDAAGLQALPVALDAWEQMADNSSPLQMRDCIKESYCRVSGGHILRI